MSELSTDLKFVLTITILGVIVIFILSSWHNDKIYKRERQERIDKQNMESSKNQNIKQTKKQIKESELIIDSLDWMLQRNIITPEEYTKLIGKCLPFLQ